MPRRSYQKPEVLPDVRYQSVAVAKLINHVMQDGKKSAARKIVYGAFDILKEKASGDPVAVFDQAVENVSPLMEVRSRRVGGATYQVPVEVKGDRRFSLAIRWILSSARAKKGSPMNKRLAEELLLSYNKEGSAYKKKEDTHRMAEANRAFAHFARR